MTQYIIYSFAVSVWCFFHSYLISEAFTRQIRNTAICPYFRILYNVFSLLTFGIIYFWGQFLPAKIYFSWPGNFKIGQIILFIVSMLLFYLGSKNYSASQFFGIEQLRNKKRSLALSNHSGFEIKGIGRYIRHPWYTASFFLLWSRSLDTISLIQNAIFSIYLIIGTLLEEQKLINEFGQEYKNYQKSVSMFFPVKWLFKNRLSAK